MKAKLHVLILGALYAGILILLQILPTEFYILLRNKLLSYPLIAGITGYLSSLPPAVKLLVFLIQVAIALLIVGLIIWLIARISRAFLGLFGADHVANYRKFDKRCQKAFAADGTENIQPHYIKIRTFGDKVKKYLLIAVLSLGSMTAGYLTLSGTHGVFALRVLLALLAMAGVPLFYGLLRLLLPIFLPLKLRLRRYRP